MSACADKRLLLHALADGELDAGNALALEAHVETCPGCAAELAGVRALKASLAEADLAWRAPEGLRRRVLRDIGAEDVVAFAPRRGASLSLERWIAGGSITALAASLALFLLVAPAAPGLPQELIEGHVRSLQTQHLIDVQTSDRHVVKPWFNGKVAFAPPVADLADAGFPLAGGRLDYIEGRTAAVLVYRRRAHVINLFVWAGDAAASPRLQRRQGYTLIRWGRGGLVFWAVSDIDPPDLAAFQRAYAARTAG
jgi:anti-sigma factor RsiW